MYTWVPKDIYKYVNRSTFLKNLKVEITQVSISDEMDNSIEYKCAKECCKVVRIKQPLLLNMKMHHRHSIYFFFKIFYYF